MSRPTLYTWKNHLAGPEVPASMKRHKVCHQIRNQSERNWSGRSTLRRDIRRLQLEHDLLKKASEIIKKGLGVSLQLLTNRKKTLLVDVLKQTHALSDLSELSLARSSYFYHRARLQVADKYGGARRAIADIFEHNHRCYGYRRMQVALSRQCVRLSEKVVQRLMKEERLLVAKPKRRRYGSYLGEISPTPDNLINRDFRAAAPNVKWLTNITEFQLPAGKVYLSPMIDCFDGMVVSWSIGTRPDAQLVNGMLDAALEKVADSDNRPVVHSDRGPTIAGLAGSRASAMRG